MLVKVGMVSVLIVEPDPWRFRGIQSVLQESGLVKVPRAAFADILTMETAPGDLCPDVILLAHRLIVDYGIALVPNLREVFGGAVLVYGDQDSLEVTAQVLAAGASGFFLMTSPVAYLVNALTVVSEGQLWGPREAVFPIAERTLPKVEQARLSRSTLSQDSEAMLRFLNEGFSNKDIASRLGIAEVTVKTRLTKLYRQFGVTTRLQLLAKAFRQGLIGSSPGSGGEVSHESKTR